MPTAAKITTWREVCDEDDILLHGGVCALVEGRQVAVFRTVQGLFAIDNRDPKSGANVLSRGIVGDLEGRLVVASPVYKHHYDLATGACLEDGAVSVATYRVRSVAGRVLVETGRRELGRRPKRLVLVGNGMAGLRALDELLALAPARYEITVFGAEPRGGYDRVALSAMLSGEKALADIAGRDADWYASRGIVLHAGDPVVEIDRIRRVVVSKAGVRAGYDRLLLATGSTALRLEVPGTDLPGVLRFRTLDDVEAMLGAAEAGGRAVVIGGGLLGVEAAAGLRARGMDVTLLHRSSTLMDRQLDREAGELLRDCLERRGIRVRTQARTVAIGGEDRVRAVWLSDGTELAADLVVTAIGIRPDVDLARAAGVQCGRGILVDDTMQTFDPSVYAIGECVQHRSATFGLVSPLWEQARVCAVHLAELGTARYRSPLPAAHLKVSGVRVFSAGEVADDAGTESIVLRDAGRGIYKRLLLREGRVHGAVLYGDTADGAMLCDLMRDGTSVAGLREALLLPGSERDALVDALSRSSRGGAAAEAAPP